MLIFVKNNIVESYIKERPPPLGTFNGYQTQFYIIRMTLVLPMLLPNRPYDPIRPLIFFV
ncbi:hypothetical protein C7820_3197 [Paenibacillus sp. VMFN-D1]|nr:hypothetical protein C7820_3197 [Paenibacillus sp. VMFN-D1]